MELQTDLATQTAEKLAFKILSCARIEKEAKEQKDQLKTELTELCNSVFENFQNGEWKLPAASAVIKLALNPHKVVDSRTNDSLNPAQRQAIALTIADKYCTVDLNTKEIQAALENDKNLKNALKVANAAIVQETRYDVKQLKD
jgi:ribosome maturation protein Sdo1